MEEQQNNVEDATRYIIDIDGVHYYVLVSTTSISVYYAHENREENIKTRTVLEKFCAGLSKLMEDNNNVSKALGNVAKLGSGKRVEGKGVAVKEVCG